MPDVEAIAAKLTKAQREALLLPEPWLASHASLEIYEHYYLHDNDLVEAVFPEARWGDSGRQFWRTTELGQLVRAHLQGGGHGDQ